jgi:hypothetical protein
MAYVCKPSAYRALTTANRESDDFPVNEFRDLLAAVRQLEVWCEPAAKDELASKL